MTTSDLNKLYLAPQFIRRLKSPTPKNDLFKKAIGKWPVHTPLLDLCGGWARDALCFASWNFFVTCLERSPSVFEMVSQSFDILRRENEFYCTLLNRIDYRFIDAKDFLRQSPDEFPVIYLDPMYNERKKNALAKGEMRALKSLVGIDSDKNELAQMAFAKAQKRLIIKSPRLAESLLTPQKASHIFKGSSTRYEIFSK